MNTIKEPSLQQERLRFAPSPTGPLHSGNLSTALFTWVRAHLLGAVLFLRMDALDPIRCKPEFEKAIFKTLDWAGLSHSEPSFTQNPTSLHYRQGLEKLIQSDRAYPCFCSRKEGLLRDARGNLFYRGTCSNIPLHIARGRIQKGEPHVWRYRTENRTVILLDEIGGKTEIHPHDWGGDFIVWKRDQTPGYPLASVTDDISMGITEINRGKDLLPASACQIFLFREFKSPVPRFLHFPLLVDAEGKKLSKRTHEHTPESLFTGFQSFFEEWCHHIGIHFPNPSWQAISKSTFESALLIPQIYWRTQTNQSTRD